MGGSSGKREGISSESKLWATVETFLLVIGKASTYLENVATINKRYLNLFFFLQEAYG